MNLLEAWEEYRKRVPKSRITIAADDDLDGWVSVYLLSRYHDPKGEKLIELVRDKPPEADIYLDICGDAPYIIDHHPCERRDILNPHVLGIPNASRYNTAFLVYLMFKEEVERNGELWKVAAASYGDSSFDFLQGYYHGLSKNTVREVSHLLSSVEGERALYKLFHAESVNDILEDEELIASREELRRRLEDYLSTGSWIEVEGENVKIGRVDDPHRGMRSMIATVGSKRERGVLYAVGSEEGGVYRFSLRLQDAESRGINLGRFCKELAEKWGTRGGGHTMAAGIEVPPEKLEEFYSLILSFYSTSSSR